MNKSTSILSHFAPQSQNYVNMEESQHRLSMLRFSLGFWELLRVNPFAGAKTNKKAEISLFVANSKLLNQLFGVFALPYF